MAWVLHCEKGVALKKKSNDFDLGDKKIFLDLTGGEGDWLPVIGANSLSGAKLRSNLYSLSSSELGPSGEPPA